MKYVNKIIAAVAILGFSLCSVTYSGDLWVDQITVIDSETISVTLSENPNLEVGEIEGEITILNDVKLRWAFPLENDAFGVELSLENALMTNTTYSLLTVTGAEGSIDFTTESDLDGFSVNNVENNEDQNIDFIEVIDDRTIFIIYKQELNSSMLEFKLLAESEVVKIEKPDYFLPELLISVEPPFISEQDYILMFIDMQDIEGKYLEFDTGIYDFTTPKLDEGVEEELSEDTWTGEIMEDKIEEDIEDEKLDMVEINQDTGTGETMEDDILIESSKNEEQSEQTKEDELSEEDISLEAAGDEVSLEKDGESDITEVAGLASETPDTGAQTWVLIMLTLVINSFYYLSRRKQKTLAA